MNQQASMKQTAVFAGIVLSMICCCSTAHAQKTDRKHDEALAAVQKFGGKVKIDAKRPDRPVEVRLSGTKAVDASLLPLKDIVNLQTVSLRLSQVTDAGLEHLGAIKQLH